MIGAALLLSLPLLSVPAASHDVTPDRMSLFEQSRTAFTQVGRVPPPAPSQPAAARTPSRARQARPTWRKIVGGIAGGAGGFFGGAYVGAALAGPESEANQIRGVMIGAGAGAVTGVILGAKHF